MANHYKQLIDIGQTGRYDQSIDLMTDCNDYFELVTGLKGVPQDRSQRLIIMSMRERRALCKFRSISWINTKAMPANSVTKLVPSRPMLHSLQRYGRLTLTGAATIRLIKRLDTYDEEYLLTMD